MFKIIVETKDYVLVQPDTHFNGELVTHDNMLDSLQYLRDEMGLQVCAISNKNFNAPRIICTRVPTL